MNAATRAFESVDYETAVSRAYYACYHAIIVAFEVKMGLTRDHWPHNFRPYFDRFNDLAELRLVLADLYAARVKADYEEAGFTGAAVEDLLQQARRLLIRANEVSDGQA